MELLERVENGTDDMDSNQLERARLLLQSDLYSAERRLDDRKRMAAERVAELEAERDKIGRAIHMLCGRLDMCGYHKGPQSGD